ncbi:MAG: 6-bladed beta-propeller [Pseudomonadota bacterium]
MPRLRFVSLFVCLLGPSLLFAGESIQFRFEQALPTLQQPWFFGLRGGIAVDEENFVYVTERDTEVIRKFNRSGLLVTSWGRRGPGDGEFAGPHDVALSDDDRVYITDEFNHRVQIFTRDGVYLAQFGAFGSGDGQLNRPTGVAQHEGFVYVADSENFRIQKFTSDGDYVGQWGSEGSGNGQFQRPEDIAISRTGFVYVIDQARPFINYENTRVQYFDTEGNFIGTWGSTGTGLGQFQELVAIEVDQFGVVFTLDEDGRIQRFTPDGLGVSQFTMDPDELPINRPSGIAKAPDGRIYVRDVSRVSQFLPTGQFADRWGSLGDELGQFNFPLGIAAQANGNLLVSDIFNNRVQVFTPEGMPLSSFGGPGSPGELIGPGQIAVSAQGDIYLSELTASRVSVFDENFNFIRRIGSFGSGNGEFDLPRGVGIDSQGFVYVADGNNHRVQKFTPDGTYVDQWGVRGSENGNFERPNSLVVGPGDLIYVADRDLDRIQIFESDGTFVSVFGESGTGPGQFNIPESMAFDSFGFLYVADVFNDRYQAFTANGEYVGKYDMPGVAPGSLTRPGGIYFDNSQRVFMVDGRNNRLQRFSRVELLPDSKVMVVAGGGPYPGNPLWDATQVNANFAYRTLAVQGFTDDLIYYLTPNLDLDLDQNGNSDEVDGVPTAQALREGVLGSFGSDADNLILYLVDHGGDKTFRLTENEILSASELDSWLDEWQATRPNGNVTLIYDACQSGSFLDELRDPNRILIASAGAEEAAYFVSQGSLSFSNRFWSQIFNGATLGEAYDLASQATSTAFPLQNPLLDADGDGSFNTAADLAAIENLVIGAGTQVDGNAPVITSVSPVQNPTASTATIEANGVTDADGIARVWAVLRPPGFAPDSADNPVQDLPTVELTQQPGTADYQAEFSDFTIAGTYDISIEAQDRIGNTAIPRLTQVVVGTPVRRRAVIIGGGDPSAPEFANLKTNSDLALAALNLQGYGPDGITCNDPSCDDVYYMTGGSSTGSDAGTNLTNVEFAITSFGVDNAEDLTVYLVAPKSGAGYRLNETEILDAATLDGWLDTAQATLPGVLTVIVDADDAQTFMQGIAPEGGQTRFLVASTDVDENASFELGGEVSFSRFFWNQTLNGARLRQAFQVARRAINLTQNAQLDVDGNGVPNQITDALVVDDYFIGSGVALAGDDPFVSEVMVNAELVSDFETITATGVTSTGSIDRVIAIVSQPDGVLVTQPLATVGDAFSDRSFGLCGPAGSYGVAVHAIDAEGNVSLPAEATVNRATDCADFQFASGFE